MLHSTLCILFHFEVAYLGSGKTLKHRECIHSCHGWSGWERQQLTLAVLLPCSTSWARQGLEPQTQEVLMSSQPVEVDGGLEALGVVQAAPSLPL